MAPRRRVPVSCCLGSLGEEKCGHRGLLQGVLPPDLLSTLLKGQKLFFGQICLQSILILDTPPYVNQLVSSGPKQPISSRAKFHEFSHEEN